MTSSFTDEYAAVVECLIDVRKAAGLSQQDLADRLGKPQSFVSKYERRERRLDVVEFLNIARQLGSDPYELLKRAENAISARATV